ncbi:NAD-dependent epimerase/dehydratase family protein [Streptomyces sp. NPDC059373]
MTTLVCGGTGFVGSAVVRELLRTAGPGDVRVLSRRPLPPWMAAAGVEGVAGDLEDPRTLRGCCAGVGVLLHLSSYVGRDPERCTAVNATGTAALLDEAERAGVRRIGYVSTASVYGHGPHRGAGEAELTPAPASAASTSRLLAEGAVHDRGGVVFRPHLVFGPGDRWFVPALVRLLTAVPFWPDGGRARSSLIAVQDLARIMAAFALTDRPPTPGSVWHAAHPAPVPLRDLVEAVWGVLGMAEPRGDVTYADHRALAAGALPELTAHQHALLTGDHWYDSDGVWRALELDPGPGFAARMAGSLPWYGEHVAVRVSA